MAVGSPARRGLMVSRVWLQAVGVVVLFGFLILGLLAYRTYVDEPPIPTQVVSSSGQVLFTGEEISRGQQVFLGNGLMEYGSVFGHGAYLGPDFTADYLRRAALSVQSTYAGQGSDNARQLVINDFQANRYDQGTGRLVYTDAQARAFTALQGYYGSYFGDPTTGKGLRPQLITSAADVHDLTAFFSWSAWAAAAHRPGKDYSYTNSWPPETLVGNGPTANVVVWSVLSLIALLGGIGALFAAFGRWGDRLGWRGRQAESISFRAAVHRLVFPGGRAALPGANPGRCRLAALPGGRVELFRYRLGQVAALQPGPHLACAVVDLLGGGGFPRGRHLLGPHHRRSGATGAAPAFLRAARRVGRGGGRQPDRGVPRPARLAVGSGVVVWGEGLRIPRPGPVLATAADRGPVSVDVYPLPGVTGAPASRAWRKYAVAVLPCRVGDPGLLRGRVARQRRRQLHHRRLLAVLGCAPVGGGLPGAVHHRDGRLRLRHARR